MTPPGRASSDAPSRPRSEGGLFRLPGLNSAARNGLIYSAGSHWGLLATMAANIFARRTVTPVAFGAVAYAYAFQIYLHQINAVVVNAVGREVPQRDAASDQAGAERVLEVGFTVLRMLIALEVVAFVIAGLLSTSTYRRLGFWTVAASLAFSGVSNFDKHVLKSRGRFSRVAWTDFAIGSLTAGLLVILSMTWGAHGYFAALALGAFGGMVVSRALVGSSMRRPFALSWDASTLRTIIAAGGPMVLLALLTNGLAYVDRFFVEAHHGLDALGYYSLATMGVSAALLLPQAVAASYLPRYLALATTNAWDLLRARSRAMQEAINWLSFLIVGTGFFAIAPLLAWVLPDYVRIVDVIRILLLNVLLLGATQVAYFAHLALRRMRLALASAASALVLALIAYSMVSARSLEWVAAASVTGFLAYVVFITFSAARLGFNGLALRTGVVLLFLAPVYWSYFGLDSLMLAGWTFVPGALWAAYRVMHIALRRGMHEG